MKSSNLFRLSLLGILMVISQIIFIQTDEFAIDPRDYFDKGGLIEDKEKVDFDDTITGDKLIDEMGFGWNLGNTLDALTTKLKLQMME